MKEFLKSTIIRLLGLFLSILSLCLVFKSIGLCANVINILNPTIANDITLLKIFVVFISNIFGILIIGGVGIFMIIIGIMILLYDKSFIN